MNRLLMLLCAFALSHGANAQIKSTYFLGIEGGGGFSRNNNPSNGKNLYITANTKLYAGLFISNKAAIYTSFGIADYEAYITTATFSNKGDSTHYKGYEYRILPKLSIGTRKYFSFIKEDIVGLFADAEIGYGINVKRLKDKMYLKTTTEKIQSTETANNFSVSVLIGAYLNLNKNWQVLLKLGGLSYSSFGTKDRQGLGRSIYLPEKHSNMSLSFSTQTIQLSFVRFL